MPLIIIFIGNWELYGVVGIGAYMVKADANLRSSGISMDLEDSETIFGFSPGLGIQYNINQKFFIGAEAKYLFTADSSFFGIDSNLNGIRVEGVLGIRF